MSISRKWASILLFTLFVISTYSQLKHPYKPVIASQLYPCDDSPGTIKAIFRSGNGKAFVIIHKIGVDFFADSPILSLLVFHPKQMAAAVACNENTAICRVPERPFLRQFSPPPEVYIV